MQLKITSLFVFVILTGIQPFFTTDTFAQIRKGGGGRKLSLYFSGGTNWDKYTPSTISLVQPKLDNSYSLESVKADSKIPNTAISPSLLNYRVGVYMGYRQRFGIELSYDPVKYHVSDSQKITEKGTINDVSNVNKTFTFSAKDGYMYSLKGGNLLLANVVRRFTLYRPNSNRVGIDAISKIGFGPCFPEVQYSFPRQSTTNSSMQMTGWNAGVEEALRVTVYRYVYLEFAGKFDYAWLSNLPVYDGTASQHFGTFELIGSIGYTLPLRKFNPLFYKGRRIITILPLSTLKDNPGKSYGETKEDRDREKSEDANSEGEVEDIPEFNDILDRKEQKQKTEQERQDSITRALNPPDTTAAVVDSTPKRQRHGLFGRRHRHDDDTANAQAPTSDTSGAQQTADTNVKAPVVTPPAPGDTATKAQNTAPALADTTNKQTTQQAAPTNIQAPDTTKPALIDSSQLSNRELKKMEKEAEREEKRKEKEQREATEKAADSVKQVQDLQAQQQQNQQDSISKAKTQDAQRIQDSTDKANEAQQQSQQSKDDSVKNAKKLQDEQMQSKQDSIENAKEQAKEAKQQAQDSLQKRREFVQDSMQKQREYAQDSMQKRREFVQDSMQKRRDFMRDSISTAREAQKDSLAKRRSFVQDSLKARRQFVQDSLQTARDRKQGQLDSLKAQREKDMEDLKEKEKAELEEKQKEDQSKSDTTGGK